MQVVADAPSEEISIHAPLAGSDPLLAAICGWAVGFQSTLPSRGATLREAYLIKYDKFQSTLPSRGATRRVVFWPAK